MNRLDLLSLQVSNMKLNLLEQRLIIRDMLSEIKHLEQYLASKEDKQ
ncbi:MAG TPA: hypothetical protein VEY68_02565 [Anoxybacillus sp.]|nr:hypothetical protein [Anoxybacillus sp.]